MSVSRYVFNVSNMKCNGCVSAVKAVLSELDDTTVIEVSLEEQQAVIETSKLVDEIAAIITAAGFPAVLK